MAPLCYLLVLTLLYQTSAHKYRLPSSYSLNGYIVSLDIGEDAFSNSSSYQYEGVSIISLQVSKTTSELQFHASHEYISLSLILLNNAQVTKWKVDNVTDIVTLTLDSELEAGTNYSLLLSYTAKLATNDTFGLYRTNYTSSKGTSYFLGTRFEPTYARRVFPCFDEPNYKGTLDLTIRHPSKYKCLTNTASGSTNTNSSTTTVTFNTKSNTSTYLQSWAISDLNSTDGTLADGSIKYRVWSRNDSTSLREWAFNITPHLIDSLNTHTGINFSTIAGKLDLLATPDTSEGVEQNWGLVKLSETKSLWDSEESSTESKQQVASAITRGLSYHWFGSLVTSKWWSNLYLSEGFANYFEQTILHKVQPQFEISKQYVVKNLHNVLETDSNSATGAVNSEASTTSEISEKFGDISSNKGGCILRMVENILGNDSFLSGCNKYLTTYKYKNAESSDLWNSLNSTANFTKSSLPADLNTVMENWINKAGYPVINVSLKDNVITFRQERFLNSGSDIKTKWYVPISYVKSDDDSDQWESTLPRLWLTPDKPSASISFNSSSTKWLLVNNKQSGYYRVNYDSHLWKKLSQGLDQANYSNISEINRAHICDDVFQLAKAKRLSYSKALERLQFLEEDDSYFSWYSAFKGFDYLLKRVGTFSSVGSSIGNHILKLSKKVRRSAPLTTLNSSDHVYTLKQNLANKWACELGDEDSVKYVKDLFEEYKKTTVRPHKDLRKLVYSNGLRYSNSASHDWNFLWKAYQESELATERATLIKSLGCTTNHDILNTYLQKSITSNSGLRNEDRTKVFSAVYKGNSGNVDVALDFLVQNHEAMVQKYNGKRNVGKLMKNIATHFSREDQLTKLKNFVNSNDLDDELLAYTNEGVEVAQTNLEWTKQHESELSNYFKVQENSVISSGCKGSDTIYESSYYKRCNYYCIR